MSWYDHLSCLELADASDGSTPMATNYYWQLMMGEIMIRHGEDGPVALHTRLGWVFSGPMAVASQETSAVNLIATYTLRVDVEPNSLMAAFIPSGILSLWVWVLRKTPARGIQQQHTLQGREVWSVSTMERIPRTLAHELSASGDESLRPTHRRLSCSPRVWQDHTRPSQEGHCTDCGASWPWGRTEAALFAPPCCSMAR